METFSNFHFTIEETDSSKTEIITVNAPSLQSAKEMVVLEILWRYTEEYEYNKYVNLDPDLEVDNEDYYDDFYKATKEEIESGVEIEIGDPWFYEFNDGGVPYCGPCYVVKGLRVD
jgi:hypothetical protein